MDFSALLKGEIAKKKQQAGKKGSGDFDKEEAEKEQAREKKRKEREEEEHERHEAYRRKRERLAKREEKEKLDMSDEQVVKELEDLGEPTVCEGEDDIGRYYRLSKVKRAKTRQDEIDREDKLLVSEEWQIQPQNVVDNQDLVNLQVRVYIRHLLNKWSEEPDELYEKSVKELDPLLNLLRHKKAEERVFAPLAAVIIALQHRDFHEANTKYTDLSIGRKAWPVGVIAVGIHARKNLSRIQGNEGDGANVMISETTRQWITSIKRLITICEQRSIN